MCWPIWRCTHLRRDVWENWKIFHFRKSQFNRINTFLLTLQPIYTYQMKKSRRHYCDRFFSLDTQPFTPVIRCLFDTKYLNYFVSISKPIHFPIENSLFRSQVAALIWKTIKRIPHQKNNATINQTQNIRHTFPRKSVQTFTKFNEN